MDKRGLDFVVSTLKEKYSYNFKWLGRPIIQVPPDIIAIQEIIWEVKPDYVIETGIAHGGGLVLYASILECLGKGKVLGIDIDPRGKNMKALEEHPLRHRIEVVKGDSIDLRTIDAVKNSISIFPSATILVILDSMHTEAHVLQELRLYAPMVSVGSYIIVFDTIIEYMPANSYPDRPWNVGDNPCTAVKKFLESPEGEDFEIDQSIDDRLLISSAPGGYLRRRR